MTAKLTMLPGLACPGPVFVTLRSATALEEIGVVTVELLLAMLASGDDVLTEAVLVMVGLG